MTECPSCGARLTGAPSWCPRCLARFDTVAPAPAVRAGTAGARGSVASLAPPAAPPRPPSMYTPYTPPPAASEPAPADTEAGGHTRSITPTVVKAILLGVVLQGVVYAISRGLRLDPAPAVALALGLTLAFYLVVFSMVQGRLLDSGVRPIWHIGPPGTALVMGVVVGSLQAGVVVALSSLLAGHVASDATATIAFAQGGYVRVAVLVLIMVVAAPVVEELLFRGLLAESLRGRGKSAAIWLSALAFALWHLRPDALRYYLLCGALLGLLYWKRGLICSMAAHATFNGLLVVVAAMSLSGPAHVVNGGGISLTAPARWQQVATPSNGAGLELRSPSGASVFAHRLTMPGAPDPTFLLDRLTSASSLGADVVVKKATVHEVQLPNATGVEVDVIDHGHDAQAVLLPAPQGVVVFELVTGGNTNARHDLDAMLRTVTFS
jgi:membrane protease YdiL (CAAX protease family)